MLIDLYRDIWNFHKKHFRVDMNDDTWQQIIRESDELYNRYKTDFAKDLVLSVVKELSRNAREVHKQNDTRI